MATTRFLSFAPRTADVRRATCVQQRRVVVRFYAYVRVPENGFARRDPDGRVRRATRLRHDFRRERPRTGWTCRARFRVTSRKRNGGVILRRGHAKMCGHPLLLRAGPCFADRGPTPGTVHRCVCLYVTNYYYQSCCLNPRLALTWYNNPDDKVGRNSECKTVKQYWNW